MAITGTVIHDLGRLEQAIKLYPKELMAADIRTRNRVAASARTQAVRLLRSSYPGVLAGTIRRRLPVKRATAFEPRAILDFLTTRLRVFGNLPLRTFITKYGTGAAITRRPFVLELTDGSQITSEQLQRLFVQRGRSGTANVFVRVGKARTPIRAVVMGSPARAFREQDIGRTILAYSRERRKVIFTQEMKYRIAKRYGLVAPRS